MFENIQEIILACLLVVYLVLNNPLPQNVAKFINTPFGKFFVVAVSLVLFFMSNPVLGVLGFLVAFDLIVKASQHNTTYDVTNNNSRLQMQQINEDVIEMQNQSLEHFVIKKMAPIPYSSTPVPIVYPLVDNLYDAKPL